MMRNARRKKWFRGLMALITVAVLCVSGMLPVGIAAANGTRRVVTSFYPLYIFTLNLCAGIDGVEVVNMAEQASGCLHDYQLQSGDMRRLAAADLFVVNGAGMESFLDMVTGALPELSVVTASDGIELICGEDDDEVNAHVWLDVTNAMTMVDNIAEGLSAQWPVHREQIMANRDGYKVRLSALDAEIRAGTADLPRRDVITFHEAFPYFAKAYGLNVAAVVTVEAGESLSPKRLRQLIEKVIGLQLPPLFIEPQYDDLSANTIAAETGARVYTLDPVVTGPMDLAEAITYYEYAMRTNLSVLREALSAQESEKPQM